MANQEQRTLQLVLKQRDKRPPMALVLALPETRPPRRLLARVALCWLAGQCAGLRWPQARCADARVNTRVLLTVPPALPVGGMLRADSGSGSLLVLASLQGLLHVYAFPEKVTGIAAYLRGVNYFVTLAWRLFTSRESRTMGDSLANAEMLTLGVFATLWTCTRLTAPAYDRVAEGLRLGLLAYVVFVLFLSDVLYSTTVGC